MSAQGALHDDLRLPSRGGAHGAGLFTQALQDYPQRSTRRAGQEDVFAQTGDDLPLPPGQLSLECGFGRPMLLRDVDRHQIDEAGVPLRPLTRCRRRQPGIADEPKREAAR